MWRTPGRRGGRFRRPARGITIAAVAAVTAACGGAPPTPEGPTPSVLPPVSPPAGSQPAQARVQASLTDFRIDLSQHVLPPGRYTFVATNNGQVPHALQVDGAGLANARTPALNPGASADLTVTLSGGTYQVYCPLDDHRRMGMHTSLLVDVSQSAPSTAPTGGGGGF